MDKLRSDLYIVMHESATEKYQAVKIKLLYRGTNLRRWAGKNRLPLGSVYNAISGKRNGIRSLRIRAKLDQFLNEPQNSNL